MLEKKKINSMKWISSEEQLANCLKKAELHMIHYYVLPTVKEE